MEAVFALAKDPELRPGVVHVLGERPLLWSDLGEILRGLGYRVVQTEGAEWSRRLAARAEAHPEDSSLLGLLAISRADGTDHAAFHRIDGARTSARLRSLSASVQSTSAEDIAQALAHHARRGFLPRPPRPQRARSRRRPSHDLPLVSLVSPSDRAVWRLVCLPHAGGSAAFYRKWEAALPAEAELWAADPSGRGARFAEPLEPSLEAAAQGLAQALSEDPRPTVLFGHSMGSVIVLRLAQLLEARGLPPDLLVVSGRDAPHKVGPRGRPDWSDADLTAEIRRLGGSEEAVLRDVELMRIFLPILRNEFRLIETAPPSSPALRLSLPILALCGEADEDATPEGLAAWAELTRGPFALETAPGGHFHLGARMEEILSRILRRRADLVGRRSAA